jgi:subtilisin-like proprotein convertase family protein
MSMKGTCAMNIDTIKQPIRGSGIPRRRLLGGASALAAASFLSLGLGVAEPLLAKKDKETKDEKKKKSKIITRTFSSPDAIAINDNTTANPYPSTIKVSGFKTAKVKDVNVVLRGLNHTFPDNIDIALVAPDGSSTVLMSDSGGGTDAVGVTLTLDDQASAALTDSGALVTGSFRPANFGAADNFPSIAIAPTSANLGALKGGSPNGEWRLFVVDDAAMNTGSISGGWDLILTMKVKKNKKKKNKKK